MMNNTISRKKRFVENTLFGYYAWVAWLLQHVQWLISLRIISLRKSKILEYFFHLHYTEK